jgi:hypothetical protein
VRNMSEHASGQQRSLAVLDVTTNPSIVITWSNVRGAANTTNKSAGCRFKRGNSVPKGSGEGRGNNGGHEDKRGNEECAHCVEAEL